MSGFRSLISPIARSSRPGTKYWPPQCRSERWAIVNVSGGAAPMRVQCKTGPSGTVSTLDSVPWQQPSFRAYAGAAPPRFANEVELEFAKILDFYGLRWDYEPRTFVLARDPDGR